MKHCIAGVVFAIPGLALAAPLSTVMELPVVGVEPIVEVFDERIPHEICRQERVKVVERGRAASATPTILGAVTGGAIGSVIGDNSGKEGIIAGAGAVLGASVGRDIGRQHRGDEVYYVNEEVCSVEYELRERERISGYRVSYRFGDTIYETRRANKPGATIAVRVDLEPLP